MTPPKPPNRDVRIDKHPRASSAPIAAADDEDTGNHQDVVPIDRAGIRERLGALEAQVTSISSRMPALESAVGDTRVDVSHIRGQLDILVDVKAAEVENKKAVAIADANTRLAEINTKVETAKLELADRKEARETGVKLWQLVVGAVVTVGLALMTRLL